MDRYVIFERIELKNTSSIAKTNLSVRLKSEGDVYLDTSRNQSNPTLLANSTFSIDPNSTVYITIIYYEFSDYRIDDIQREDSILLVGENRISKLSLTAFSEGYEFIPSDFVLQNKLILVVLAFFGLILLLGVLLQIHSVVLAHNRPSHMSKAVDEREAARWLVILSWMSDNLPTKYGQVSDLAEDRRRKVSKQGNW